MAEVDRETLMYGEVWGQARRFAAVVGTPLRWWHAQLTLDSTHQRRYGSDLRPPRLPGYGDRVQ